MQIKNRTRKFSDFSLSFKKNPLTGDIIGLSGDLAVKRSVTNLLLTVFGERFYQPDIGTGIKRKLFESYNVTINIEIENEIKRVLSIFEPRIEVRSIDINFEDTENSLNIFLEYLILADGIIDSTKLIYKLPSITNE